MLIWTYLNRAVRAPVHAPALVNVTPRHQIVSGDQRRPILDLYLDLRLESALVLALDLRLIRTIISGIAIRNIVVYIITSRAIVRKNQNGRLRIIEVAAPSSSSENAFKSVSK